MNITPTSDADDFLWDDPDDLTDEQMAESRAGIQRGLHAQARRRQRLSARSSQAGQHGQAQGAAHHERGVARPPGAKAATTTSGAFHRVARAFRAPELSGCGDAP